MRKLVDRRLKRLLRWAITALMLVLLILPPVHAQAEQVTVRLDGRAVFRVGAVGELDATARARQIERRMNRLLENPEAIAPPRIEPTNANTTDRVITIAGVPIVTVTEADAQDNLTTVNVLATQWSQAIDTTLERASERRLSPAGRFIAEVQASIETAFGRLIESAIVIIPRALAALLVIGLFWAIATFVRWLMRIIFRRIVEDLTIENLIKLEARFWTDSRRSDFVATTSQVRQAIVAALKDAEIGLPDPDVRILMPRHLDQWQAALKNMNSNIRYDD